MISERDYRTIRVTCDYCGKDAELVDSSVIYPHRLELHGRNVYRCQPCGAWVGCHPNTVKPLGRLANAELRRAKMQAHAVFDPLWRDGTMTRGKAYKALAIALNIPKGKCHIGMFDVEQCERVIAAVNGGLGNG